MKVSVFGLGYVGAVSCGCFANDGHTVIGVDINETKTALINSGQTPIVEELIGDLIKEGVESGRLRATSDIRQAVMDTDIVIISVGTPSNPNGSLSLDAVERVSEQIGEVLRDKAGETIVVVRSTVLPGTVRNLVIPKLEEASGKRAGEGFHVCFNPEFLREGDSVKDHYDPPFTLIGCDDESVGARVAGLYAKVKGELILSTLETAEMVKYVCNAFHALKLTFANEVGIIAQSLGADSHEVMEIVCKDRKLNISDAYMRPGFAFGGSCLPKDVSALRAVARHGDLEVPLLHAIMESNSEQVQRAIDTLFGLGKKPVSVLGLSFKAGTDDLRNSPLVAVTEALIGKGYDLKIYDTNVSMARLVGANKAYIEKEIPHISSLLTQDLEDAVASAEILVIGNGAPEFRTRLPGLLKPGQTVVDLTHVPELAAVEGVNYHGIVW